jgi:hypothetical protein
MESDLMDGQHIIRHGSYLGTGGSSEALASNSLSGFLTRLIEGATPRAFDVEESLTTADLLARELQPTS